MLKKAICILIVAAVLLCGCSHAENVPEQSGESYPTVSEIKAMMPQIPDENYVESYYGGKLNIVRCYVTEDEIDPNYDICEGDMRYGVTDADGNLILDKIYDDVKILSENRICAAQRDAEKNGIKVNYLTSIFDAKGRIISDKEYWIIHYYLSPVTGNYFPIGSGQAYDPDDAEIMYYLVDFDGNKVLDRRIIRVLRYGDDPIADDPNVLIALDYYNDEQYIIDSEGNITRGSDEVTIVHGSKAG